MKVPKPRRLPSGSWFVQLRLGGESISITEATEKAAIRRAEQLKAEYRNGRKIYERPTDLTLWQAEELYIEEHKAVLSPTTIRGYGAIQRNRFQSVIDKRLEDINWQAAINIETRICSTKTLKNAWRFVASVIRHQDLPVPRVTLPMVTSKTREWLDYEEIAAFLSAIEGSRYELPALLALSSLRRSEIYGLGWEDIDLNRNSIHVHRTMVEGEKSRYVLKETTKTNSSTRTVPILIPRLRALLAAESKKTGLVFPITNPDTANHAIGALAEAAGLRPVTLHGLRHSFASLAHHVGMDQQTCMRIGGWSDPATMQRIYTHVSERDQERHENAMKAYFVGVAEKNANENANEITRTG